LLGPDKAPANLKESAQLVYRIDPAAGGDWNMAVDEMLLEAAAERGVATLRFYRWTPATLSLGYFQNAADRAGHAASRACPLVRRSSGGGALVHDAEVTYSLSLPTGRDLPASELASDPETLYRCVHGSLVGLLGEMGITAQLNERVLVPFEARVPPGTGAAAAGGSSGEPFLCFHRRAVGDVLVGEHKICGSAQRRRKGAILQHGGVLLARSAAAPELPGLTELAGRNLDVEAFIGAWLAQFQKDIYPCRRAESYTAGERERIEFFRAGKYADDSWVNRR